MRRVPTALAAHAAGVKPGTIRQWVRRGKLTRYPDGYDLNELLDASDNRNLDALLSRAGIRPQDRPGVSLADP